MTPNQILQQSLKDYSKVIIFLTNHPYPYENAIVTKLTRDYVSFIIPMYNEGTEQDAIFEYTFKRTLIEGAGFIRAAVNTKLEDEEIEEY